MTDKLKCPFCGEELERCSYLSKGITNPVFVCRNRKCKFVDKIIDSEIWQALIDGKKAQEALKKARDMYKKTLIDYIRVLYSIAPDFIDKHIYEEMFKYDKEIAFIIKQEKIKC